MKAVYTVEQLRDLLELRSTNAVWSLVRQGVIPEPFYKSESIVRWRAADIHESLGMANV